MKTGRGKVKLTGLSGQFDPWSRSCSSRCSMSARRKSSILDLSRCMRVNNRASNLCARQPCRKSQQKAKTDGLNIAGKYLRKDPLSSSVAVCSQMLRNSSFSPLRRHMSVKVRSWREIDLHKGAPTKSLAVTFEMTSTCKGNAVTATHSEEDMDRTPENRQERSTYHLLCTE